MIWEGEKVEVLRKRDFFFCRPLKPSGGGGEYCLQCCGQYEKGFGAP